MGISFIRRRCRAVDSRWKPSRKSNRWNWSPNPSTKKPRLSKTWTSKSASAKPRIKKNCKVARRNKALLETTANIVGPDEAGNEVLLSTSEKVGRLAEATDQVQTYCS